LKGVVVAVFVLVFALVLVLVVAGETKRVLVVEKRSRLCLPMLPFVSLESGLGSDVAIVGAIDPAEKRLRDVIFDRQEKVFWGSLVESCLRRISVLIHRKNQ